MLDKHLHYWEFKISNPKPNMQLVGAFLCGCTVVWLGVLIPLPGRSQTPNPVTPTRERQQSPQLLPPEVLIEIAPEAPTTPEQVPKNFPETPIEVTKFEFEGNTKFTDAELHDLTKDYIGKSISFAQLLEAASLITDLYLDQGYLTSGGYIPEQPISGGRGPVTIQVAEGSLEDIQVIGSPRLESYVRDRLALVTSKPLNINELQEALQLLQLDPLIETLSANVSAGTELGQNILRVKVKQRQPLTTQLSFDNSRSPSVGTEQGQLQLNQANLLGMGDGLTAGYSLTEGNNQWDFNYRLPINARNGSISLSYNRSDSEIIESPFDDLDIESEKRSYGLTWRQPVIQTAREESPQNLVVRNLAIGLTSARQESDTELLGVGFPLSPGADEDGKTKVNALRFFQEWTRESRQEAFAARSQFSLGIGWFDATVNSSDPDSRFLAWRGQFQWLRQLSSDNIILIRSDVQLATTGLVSLEQFGLGGQATVRGYRQDALLADNGAFASVEYQWTPGKQTALQVIPFVDIGTVWRSDGKANPDPNTLVSVGLGLRLKLANQLTIRLDWGIPLVDNNSRERTWQENGLHFSVQYNPFSRRR